MVRIGLAVAALVVVLTVFCAVDAATIDRRRVRGFPRWGWLLLILFLPVIGSVLWLWLGRGRIVRSTAPDDDPEFLADLRKRLDQQRPDRTDEADERD